MSLLIKKVVFPEIVDNLDSVASDKSLSAKQGNVIKGKTQQATQVVVGISRAASQAEVNAGSVATEFVSPLTAKSAPWAAKAYVLFDGDGSVIKSFNVSGVTKNSTGDYTINFSSDLADDPIVSGSVKCYSGTSTAVLGLATDGIFSVSAIQVHTFVNTATPVLINPMRASVVIF